MSGGKQGSVLILTVWALLFLCVLALAVAAHVQAALRLASALKTDQIAYHAAKAGVERAIMEVACDSNGWDSVTESWGDNEDIFKDISVGEGRFTVSWSTKQKHATKTVKYGMKDEESRINLNSIHIKKPVFRAMLERIGEISREDASRIADAILDWRDSDDRPLTDGAESSYYMGLNRSYTCANAPFLSVQELMLVRDVDVELFVKIEPCITVFGTGAVNINTAGHSVLASLADAAGAQQQSVSDDLADKIIAFREGGGVFEKAELRYIRGLLERETVLESAETKALQGLMPYIAVSSSCFRGIVSGSSAGAFGSVTGDEDLPERTIVFVFDRNKRANVLWFER
ncbi:MAG: general secretion pathway protein GspK [Kiritimatiellae bacterium]|nr:general secretion pathway protein GspK [Kiritimatiellia bacterium]